MDYGLKQGNLYYVGAKRNKFEKFFLDEPEKFAGLFLYSRTKKGRKFYKFSLSENVNNITEVEDTDIIFVSHLKETKTIYNPRFNKNF